MICKPWSRWAIVTFSVVVLTISTKLNTYLSDSHSDAPGKELQEAEVNVVSNLLCCRDSVFICPLFQASAGTRSSLLLVAPGQTLTL